MRPLLTVHVIKKLQQRCTRLLNDFKSHGNGVINLSDEKNFTVDPVINKKNDRVVSSSHDISGVSTAKHSSSVMMLGVVSLMGRRCHQ